MITAAGRNSGPRKGNAPKEASFTAMILETIRHVTKIAVTRGRKR